MARRCSYCGNNGHNSRTCDSSRGHDCGLKLFGFNLQVAPPRPAVAAAPPTMERCLSMECLTNAPPSSTSPPASSTSSLVSIGGNTGKLSNGHLLGLLGRNAERKKGVPWSEEEHRVFLVGLEKLGKGDWRGISRRFVTSRTPTQVASHAQKYFLRQSSVGKRKRRTSLFDAMEQLGRACHATNDSYKLSDPSLSAEPHPNSLSLDSRSQGVHDKVQNNLNSDSHQARQNSLCLNLMPDSSSITEAALEMQPPSALDKPDVVKFSLPDLELKISLSRSIDKNGISVT